MAAAEADALRASLRRFRHADALLFGEPLPPHRGVPPLASIVDAALTAQSPTLEEQLTDWHGLPLSSRPRRESAIHLLARPHVAQLVRLTQRAWVTAGSRST